MTKLYRCSVKALLRARPDSKLRARLKPTRKAGAAPTQADAAALKRANAATVKTVLALLDEGDPGWAPVVSEGRTRVWKRSGGASRHLLVLARGGARHWA